MTEQLNLLPEKNPKVTSDEVALLLGLLRGRGWLKAAEVIELALGTHGLRWHDRKIREIAQFSQGQIISGQNGYKLTLQATIEEVQHSAAWLRHQAGEMTRRAVEIDRVYHRKKRDHETKIG